MTTQRNMAALDRCHTCDFVFDAWLWRVSKSHRIEQLSIPKTKKKRVARLCDAPWRNGRLALSHSRLYRRCDIGLRGLAIWHVFPEFGERWSGGVAIPFGDMRQAFADALVEY